MDYIIEAITATQDKKQSRIIKYDTLGDGYE